MAIQDGPDIFVDGQTVIYQSIKGYNGQRRRELPFDHGRNYPRLITAHPLPR